MRATFLRRQADGASQLGRAEENARGLLGHQRGGQNRAGGGADGDETVVLQQDDAGRTVLRRDELVGLLHDFLRENGAGIDVGNEDRFGAAADDFVGEPALLGEAPARILHPHRGSN